MKFLNPIIIIALSSSFSPSLSLAQTPAVAIETKVVKAAANETEKLVVDTTVGSWIWRGGTRVMMFIAGLSATELAGAVATLSLPFTVSGDVDYVKGREYDRDQDAYNSRIWQYYNLDPALMSSAKERIYSGIQLLNQACQKTIGQDCGVDPRYVYLSQKPRTDATRDNGKVIWQIPADFLILDKEESAKAFVASISPILFRYIPFDKQVCSGFRQYFLCVRDFEKKINEASGVHDFNYTKAFQTYQLKNLNPMALDFSHRILTTNYIARSPVSTPVFCGVKEVERLYLNLPPCQQLFELNSPEANKRDKSVFWNRTTLDLLTAVVLYKIPLIRGGNAVLRMGANIGIMSIGVWITDTTTKYYFSDIGLALITKRKGSATNDLVTLLYMDQDAVADGKLTPAQFRTQLQDLVNRYPSELKLLDLKKSNQN